MNDLSLNDFADGFFEFARSMDLRRLMRDPERSTNPPDLPEQREFSQDELDGAIVDILRKRKPSLLEVLEGTGVKALDDLSEIYCRGALDAALENKTQANLISLALAVIKRARETMDDQARAILEDE